jgi:hypothetical protein
MAKGPITETIVFSLLDGNVWASWPSKSASVELGRYAAVTYMMRDFLAQCDLGERLNDRKASQG